MTDDEFAAQGRDLVERFAQATKARQQVGELAAEMQKGPISADDQRGAVRARLRAETSRIPHQDDLASAATRRT